MGLRPGGGSDGKVGGRVQDSCIFRQAQTKYRK